MPTLHIRNVPETLYDRLKERAQTENRSLSAEVIVLLDQVLSETEQAQADVLEAAFNLALQFEITAYDASYVALAQQLRLPLVTADETLVRKLAGSDLDVRSLAEL